jgi:HK97 family phage portal protein
VTLFRAARAAVQELRSSPENPSYPLTSATLVELFAGGKTNSGVYVSEASAHKVIAVYRAWSLLGGTIGSLPLQAFRGEAPGGERWAGDEAGLLAYPGGRDPVTGIATPGTPAAVLFYETLVVHLLSWGNAYVVRVPNEARSRTVALDLLMPHQVQPRWVRKTAANPAGKEFVVMDGEGVSTATPRDVIHIRAMGHSLLQGLSPIGAARQALGLAVAAEEYGARLFGSGSLMAGILQTDQKLSGSDAEALKDRWRAKMAGLAHAHEVAVLDSGAKWQPVGIPPEDSQFIESRKFQITEIARLYGIPPHMLGDVERSTSWGTGIEQQGISFNIFTLRPWLSRVEQALSNELLPRGVNCRFNVSELLRGDVKTRYEAYRMGIEAGFLMPADARAQEGLPFVEGSDQLMFPMNYGSLTNVANPPVPSAEPAVPNPVEVP